MTHPTTQPRDQLEQAYLKLESELELRTKQRDDAMESYLLEKKMYRELRVERDKLKAEREQMETQEPVGSYWGKEKEYGYNLIDLYDDVAVGTKLYAQPFPSTEQLQKQVRELEDYVNQLEAISTTEAELQSECERLLLENSRREKAEAKLAELEKQEPVGEIETYDGLLSATFAFAYSDKMQPGTLLYAHPPASAPDGKVFNVFHEEKYVGSFLQGSFSTIEKAQKWIDAQTGNGRFDGELSISECELDSLLKAAQQGE